MRSGMKLLSGNFTGRNKREKETDRTNKVSLTRFALVSDSCLFEALKFLPRDDIDQLPMAGRRFHRVVSNAHFQSAPLRVLDSYVDRSSRECLLPNTPQWMVEKYPRVFSKLTSSPGRFRYDRDVFPRWRMRTLLEKSPWLRCRKVALHIGVATELSRLATLCQLWEGADLKIVSATPLTKSSRTRDLVTLVGECRSLRVSHWSGSNSMKLSLAGWDLAANWTCMELSLESNLYGMTWDQLINDFLLSARPPGDGGSTKRLQIERVSIDDATVTGLVEQVKQLRRIQRFISLEWPARFSLLLKINYRDTNLPTAEPNNVEVVEHPNAANGQCRIEIKQGMCGCEIKIDHA